jgi:hypothetical protein
VCVLRFSVPTGTVVVPARTISQEENEHKPPEQGVPAVHWMRIAETAGDATDAVTPVGAVATIAAR